MRIFKRIIALVMLCVCVLPLVAACSERTDGEKIKILCTIFPQYDWTRSVIGETANVELGLLVDNGADMHSFQPSFADVMEIKKSDAVIYIGGESDAWVEEALEDAENTLAIKLSELEGMTLYEVSSENHDHSHEYGDGHAHDHGHDHSELFDEHLWLSVANARAAVEGICDALCELDADNADSYRVNSQEYIAELAALDLELDGVMQSATKEERLVFADRFPFVYLFEEYGISYRAAFDGCTTDTNADFDTVIRLSQLVREFNSSYVLVTESSDGALARTVISESGVSDCELAVLDSMQSLTGDDIAEASYIQIMRGNISTLKKIFVQG